MSKFSSLPMPQIVIRQGSEIQVHGLGDMEIGDIYVDGDGQFWRITSKNWDRIVGTWHTSAEPA